MRILLLGAAGFIGRELLAALAANGHRVTAAVRRRPEVVPPGAYAIATVDLNHATDPASWAEHLADCDAVVNCAGVLQGSRAQSIEAIHQRAPIALFQACEKAGVKRVVQISAISAERAAGTAYALTKLAADDYLRSTTLEWTVVRPSLVIARGAYGGTAFFRALAALPLAIPVPDGGKQEFQPVHVRDVAGVVLAAIEGDTLLRKTVDPVGPETVTLRRLLEDYRRWLGFGPVPVITVPARLISVAAWIGDRLGGPVNSTSAAQLAFGNTGDADAFREAVGFTPMKWREALAAEPAHVQDRWHARIYFVRPLLRWALVLLWLVSGAGGAASVGDWTPALADATGLSRSASAAILWALCAADVAIAVLVAASWRPRRLAGLQFAMIAGYTAVATVLWPAMWADPLGVLLKNIPILAAVLAWGAIEEDR